MDQMKCEYNYYQSFSIHEQNYNKYSRSRIKMKRAKRKYSKMYLMSLDNNGHKMNEVFPKFLKLAGVKNIIQRICTTGTARM